MSLSPRTRLLALSTSMLLLAGCGKAMDAIAAKACLEEDMSPKDDIEMCTRAIGATTDNVDLATMYLVRAQAHNELDQLDEAVADLDKAIQLDAELPEAWVERGNVRIQQEKYDLAAADFAGAIELDPEYGDAHFGQAVVFELTDRYDLARAPIERAIELFEDDLYARSEARGERCWIRAVLGVELEDAIADCDAALRADDEAYNVMDSRGLVNFRLGRHRDAIADYDRALAGDPENADGHYVRGLARRALGEAAQAEADIAKALQLDAEVAQRIAGYGVGVADVAAAVSTTAGEATP